MRLIDADELKKAIMLKEDVAYETWNELYDSVLEEIDNAQTVEPEKVLVANVTFDQDKLEQIVRDQVIEPIKNGELVIKEERPTGEWIPITYRPLTAEERIAFAEHYGIEYCDTLDEKAFDCPMPEDRQEILISKSWGVVEDVADNDIDGEGFICYGLEVNGDWDGVDAWMPKPERYKKGDEKE